MVKTYTDSIYYHIRLTARYLKLLVEQLFEGLNIKTTFDDFIALEVISNNPGLCQRDLAKILVKDRANTGRIINTLEKQGYVIVNIDKKGNRLVKKISLTNKGKKFIEETMKKITPYLEHIDKSFDKEMEEQICSLLKSLVQKLNELVETQI